MEGQQIHTAMSQQRLLYPNHRIKWELLTNTAAIIIIIITINVIKHHQHQLQPRPIKWKYSPKDYSFWKCPNTNITRIAHFKNLHSISDPSQSNEHSCSALKELLQMISSEKNVKNFPIQTCFSQTIKDDQDQNTRLPWWAKLNQETVPLIQAAQHPDKIKSKPMNTNAEMNHAGWRKGCAT